MNLEEYIEVIPDFPKKGVQFKDVTSLMQNGEAYKEAINQMSKLAKDMGAEVIVGPESRGFLFGCPVAFNLNLPFIPVRKPGKLPRETINYTYDLEYGTDTLCMHKDSIKKGQKVVIVDDIVALGGTMEAVINMVNLLGGEVVGLVCLIGLTSLPGVKKLEPFGLKCLIYDNVEDK
ncbi:MAG: adenine phosphoribosyltransferase [Bacillales bacterium]|nr:adenine phosphoribosyltransferase [Bacillales bacterium]